MHRNGTLDYARLLAAFGIVFFHAQAPGAAIGYAALPFFLMLLVVLAFPGAERLSFSAYLRGRAHRLLKPWLIWSGVYGALKLAEIALTGATFRSEFAINMILTGTALHLWFLPFAFLTCVMLYPLTRGARRIGPEALAFVMVGAGVAMLLLLQVENTLPVPFAQWLYGMPPVCLGIALALVWGNLPIMLMILGAFSGVALLCSAHFGLFQFLLAGGALVVCMLCPLPSSPRAQLAGSLSLGVYLAHPIVLSVLSRATPVPEKSLLMALLGCLGGLIIAFGVHLVSQHRTSPSRPTSANEAKNTIS